MNEDVTRRKFLRTFAALSSSAALLRFATGCGDSGGRMVPVYGVIDVPAGTTTVSAMSYVDALGVRTDLHNNSSVAVNGKLEVVFSADMNQGSVTLAFQNANNAGIPFDLTWTDARTAQVVPTVNLQAASQYVLAVIEGLDSSGKNLFKMDHATFTTLP